MAPSKELLERLRATVAQPLPAWAEELTDEQWEYGIGDPATRQREMAHFNANVDVAYSDATRKRYSGQWIAVQDGRVVASHADWRVLLDGLDRDGVEKAGRVVKYVEPCRATAGK